MKNDPKYLELKRPLLFFLGFILIVGSLIKIFTFFDTERKEQVYIKYQKETIPYIHKNQKGLETIFTTIFPDTLTEFNMKAKGSERISSLISNDLKDYSSTAFIKKSGPRILTMSLSGDVTDLYFGTNNAEKQRNLYNLLEGKVDAIPWDDYTYTFQGKEVVFPVKDKNNKVIGAIIRGVIE